MKRGTGAAEPDGDSVSRDLWRAVDDYFADRLIGADPTLDAALAASEAAGLPPIQVSANQGRFLHLMARLRGARRILEVGTLGGYSTIWLGRALPTDGRLVTLEIDPKHADVARRNIAAAGLGDRVELRTGPALDSLAQLAEERSDPFDLIFIDADKPSNPDYFRSALQLSAPGSLIIIDNVVRDGRVLDPESREADVVGVRRMVEMIGADPRVTATTMQTVGSKGYDGFTLALVEGRT
jgi:predicted O-methyltransferase YrrM